MYKLSFSDLKNMGFSDPSKVSVHGYGGWIMDEDFRKPYLDDLPTVPVYKGTDYLLFYGKGVRKWEYDSGSGTFAHTNNPYSLYGCYFLTDNTETKEMTTAASGEGATLVVNTFDDYVVHEEDLISVNKSGRDLFGESFSLTRTKTLSMPSIPGITNDDAKVTMRFIARGASSAGKATLSISNQDLLNLTIPAANGYNYPEYIKAIARTGTATWTGDKSESPKVTVSYNPSGHTNVHLDYIRLQVKRTLQPYGASTLFRSLASKGNTTRFVIKNANASTLVFDITDSQNPQRVETSLNGTELSFTIPQGELREFALVQPDKTFPSYERANGYVAAQDLHKLGQTDMVIIAAPTLKSQAERLAEEHRQRDNLTVEVVEPEKIYNEFSSGTPDATAIRRFMKMFYDRSTSETDAPKYLLLFGDGVYDNRFLCEDLKDIPQENMLLTYQSTNSLDINSYVTEDYFGFLEDQSGSYLSNDKLQIGIGRFPVRTVEEATLMVDKTIAYMNNTQFGSWKNKVAFIADDGNNADTFTTNHMNQANKEADYIEGNHPEFLVNKIFLDAYKKDHSGQSSYPDVNKKIQQLLKSGLMLINYTGHGGTEALADEHVITQSDINQSTYTNLPLWITATCDFTRFDAPTTSAGESVFLNKKSGGIALFSTTRVVLSGPNFNINMELLANLFEKENGRRITLGDVIKITKRNLGNDSNKLNFLLVGDPAMKLSYPEYHAKVTSVNGEPVDGSPIILKALQKVTVEGEITTPNGEKAEDFTGIVNPTVLDSKRTITTLDNNNIGQTFSFTDYPNTIFIGNDSVRNGKFSFTFTVPKDISYSNDYGKMNLYASDETKGTEAQGSFINFIVGGTSDDTEKDTEGPEIKALYLNDSTFTDGGQVNTTPLFVAQLWDKSGVNITGNSVGHDITLTIDNQSALNYNLNSYYESVPGKEGEGFVTFSIPALNPGIHTAEFKVWDIQNNSTTKTFSFEVVEGLKPNLYELIGTPNPAREQVEFRLYHNRPETNVAVNIMIYDMAGRLLWNHSETGSNELFKAYIVTWNLTDNNGARLHPGIYLYRAAISSNHSKEATKTKKLVILAQ
ncbi:Por secretion system C-terminal sorting domain-containing protein [Parabacteroides chinchillae]|uniref:Por secretion system C-terminal sorting domain-containing protein n=2 Tax=Parabacteroides chinchillae TaxID=871327 RepID=A0A8G2BY17_9BACT|nr:Por secretion system C-terminal sorting domain-containing protein [Parabacteroides chinchillae]